jgi:hypothetical protein
MKRGVKVLLATAVLGTAGCASEPGELKIRAVADPLTKAIRPGNPLIGEANGLLALGNVGLAIEAYRKVLRDDPNSIEALAGLAECYDQMGRPDISRAKYEAALAIAPKNAVLLRTFAASLERQGLRAEGLALRVEADQAEADEAAELGRMASASLTMPLPAAASPVKAATAPARVAPKVAVAPPAPLPPRVVAVVPMAPAPKVATARESVSAPAQPKVATVPMAPSAPATVTLSPPPAFAAPIMEVARPSTTPVPVQLPTVAVPKPATIVSVIDAIQWKLEKLVEPEAPSVTVKLPAARPASAATEQAIASRTQTAFAQPPRAKLGIRLERLSLGEVALLTSGKPQWQPLGVKRSLASTPVNFVPLARESQVRFASLTPLRRDTGVRLLNAARHEGLAARTRVALNRGGWKMVTIGDAGRIRQRSLVLYSPATELIARRLAAQYGFGIAKEARPGPLTVLLGRDAVGRTLARG